jgi:hypothetical protein
MKHRKFSEVEFKEAVAKSNSIHQTMLSLGLCAKGGGAYRAFYNAVAEFGVSTSHFSGKGWSAGKTLSPKRPLSAYLTNAQPINSYRLKNRLLKEGLFDYRCSCCGYTEWMGKPIPLELDHIDGIHFNNEISNLRLICPNCHAQTPNHAGKNKGRARYS